MADEEETAVPETEAENAEQQEAQEDTAPEDTTTTQEAPKEVGDEKENKKKDEKVTNLAASLADRMMNQPSIVSEGGKMARMRREMEEQKNKCPGLEPWECDKEPLWRIYMKTYADDAKKREEDEIEKYGEFHKRKPPKDPPRWPGVCPSVGPICQKLNVFNARGQDHRAFPPTDRIWERMRDSHSSGKASATSSSTSFEWPKLYPCSKRDIVRERKILARKAKMKKLGALPCKVDEIDSPESSDDEKLQEMANLKELGHARIPRTLPLKHTVILVDRACGEKPGLVEGDYSIFRLVSKKGGNRTYANICLRGMLGMHLAELGRLRERTWKFCLYQALVALLTKTQFRYKYVWSANIDYIYEHAWMLFLHVGYINALKKQRFDDVLVYNYKYSVEFELIDELTGIKVDPSVGFDYVERALKKQSQKARNELTLAKSVFGSEREAEEYNAFVHKSTKRIEKWFDKLETRFTNCIYRTTRFSLAFWKDGPFWYMYNPYRCDVYGFWNDEGAACIVKFCTREALKRHLMILTLRAYAYENEMKARRDTKRDGPNVDEDNEDKEKEESFAVQLYQLIYHDCQLHNVKLYNRQPAKRRQPMVEKKPSDPCNFDPLAHLAPKICRDDDDDDDDETTNKTEKPRWVRDLKITWTKNIADAEECRREAKNRSKWHDFEVLQPRRLYVLWGDLHISDERFARKNRHRQAGCCYVVCAGMIMINAPEYWSSEVLNAIVVCGDGYFIKRKTKLEQTYGWTDIQNEHWDSLPRDQFRIGGMRFDFKIHPASFGHLFTRDNQSLWSNLERLFQRHNFCILNCDSSNLGVFEHCGAYYVLDASSYGPPYYGKGQAGSYLLRAACIVDLVKCLVLVIGTPECRRFELRPVEIIKVVDLGEVMEERPRKCGRDVAVTSLKPKCPLEEERRKASKRRRRNEEKEKEEENKKLIDVVICAKRDT